MGVYRTDYLMWAVDMGADAFDWDKHEAESNGAPIRRFDIVYDGMSGQYCMAGKIIATSDAHEGFAVHRIDPVSVDVDKDDLAMKVSDAFAKHVSSSDFALVLFSHYS
jgi:hypothetical protein